MKIVCDSCGTKYSIADEKVRGKVFKIRCKKCSHIIVVRGGETGGPEATAAPAAEGGWHLVIDGEQVGPIADADVRTKIERGEIKGDTYIWKEGFADWVKLSAVPEFAGLVAEDVAGTRRRRRSLHRGAALRRPPTVPSARAVPQARAARCSAAVAPATSSRLRRPPPRSGGGDLFGSAAAAPAAEESRWPSSGAAAAGHDGGRVESLTGQRHENSVLFSLSNLQSLAMPAAKPAATASSSAPSTEGSGLIDIRAMAASTLGASGGASPSFGGFGGGGSSASDDLPAFGAFSPAAPVLLPLSSRSGPPVWVYIIIALFAVAIAGIGLAAYKVLSAKSPVLVEQVQQIPAPQEPAKAAPAAAEPGAKPTTIAEENLPPRAGGPEAKGGREVREGRARARASPRRQGRQGERQEGGRRQEGERRRCCRGGQRAIREEAGEGIARRFDRRRDQLAPRWRRARQGVGRRQPRLPLRPDRCRRARSSPG